MIALHVGSKMLLANLYALSAITHTSTPQESSDLISLYHCVSLQQVYKMHTIMIMIIVILVMVIIMMLNMNILIMMLHIAIALYQPVPIIYMQEFNKHRATQIAAPPR